jgi:hypothetical protein
MHAQRTHTTHPQDPQLALQAAHGKQAYLVQQIGDLVRVCVIAISSSHDTLQIAGLRTLQTLVRTFQDAMDPDYEDTLLMEMYQAQITSALRQALCPIDPKQEGQTSSPAVRCAACSTAVTVLSSGLMSDEATLKRVLGHLYEPFMGQGMQAW